MFQCPFMLSPGSRDLIEREILNDKTAQVRRVQAQDLSTHTLGYQPDIRLSKTLHCLTLIYS